MPSLTVDQIAKRAAFEARSARSVALTPDLPTSLLAAMCRNGVVHLSEALDPMDVGAPELALCGADAVTELGELLHSGLGPRAATVLRRVGSILVVASHLRSDGSPRIVAASPETQRASIAVVSRILTEIALIDVLPGGLFLREVAAGVSAREVQERTGANLFVDRELVELTAEAPRQSTPVPGV